MRDDVSNSLALFAKATSVVVIILIIIIASIDSLKNSDKRNSAFSLGQLHYLIDKSQQLDIRQVQQSPDFRALGFARDPVNFGHDNAAHWLQFDLKAKHQGALNNCLAIDVPIGSKVRLFLNDVVTQQGLPYLIKRLNNRKIAYCLDIKKDKNYQAYLRLQHDYEVMFVSLKPMTFSQVEQSKYQTNLFLSLILGGLILITGYNVLLFLTMQDNGYLHIVMFASCIIFELCMKQNILLLDKAWVDWAQMLFPLIATVMVVAAFGFVQHVILQWQPANGLLTLLSYCKIGAAIILPISVLLPNSYFILYSVALGTAIIGFGSIVYASYLGNQFARGSLGTVFFVCLSFVPIFAFQLEWVEYIESFELLHFGGLLMASIFVSLLQASHINRIKKEFETAQARSHAKDKFLATISHELRTPMHTLMGVAGLLKQNKISPAQQQNYVQQLQATSQHMLALIDDILDLSRLENSDIQLRPNVFYLPHLMKKLEALFEVPAQTKGLNLTFHIEGESDNWVTADEQRLKQVIVNLLGNAIKYTDAGCITLKLRVTCLEDDSYNLYCEVSDTGIGIAESDLPYLFHSFYQVQAGYERHYGGSGLGLSISQHLVKRMGGSIGVTSQLGQGSQFFFVVSVDHAEPICDAVAINALPMLDNTQVLLVDDDVINASLGQAMLHTEGMQVTIANSGAEAIHTLHQQRPDIVFMDISMPEMSGYEATRAIRQIPLFVDIPIVALTAHAIEGERERCLNAGMNDYLTKPFTANEIMQTIAQWIPHKNLNEKSSQKDLLV